MISTSQRPLRGNIQHSEQTDIHAPAEFETAILASERPQTQSLDRAATGIGNETLDLYYGRFNLQDLHAQQLPVCEISTY